VVDDIFEAIVKRRRKKHTPDQMVKSIESLNSNQEDRNAR
jgi:hypothetical protein